MYVKTPEVAFLPLKRISPYPADVEADADALEEHREQGEWQLKILPFLCAPLLITAFLAYMRSVDFGVAYFALRWLLERCECSHELTNPVSELIALILIVASVIVGKIDGPKNDLRQNILALLAAVIGLFGFIVVFTVKQVYEKPHFLSPHSHLGLFTFISIASYAIVSVVVFNPASGIQRNSEVAQRLHTNWGRGIIVLGIVTASAGIFELVNHNVEAAVGWIGTLATFLPFTL